VRSDRFNAPQNALESRRRDVCEFATVAIPSTGIGDDILQIGETWLQCRQQADQVCQVLQEKKGTPTTIRSHLLG
jgi:hypothetical protein